MIWVAGVDEVGRGPLAGPVIAAAVVLPQDQPIEGLADSKTLTAARRERLAVEIRERACSWGIGRAEVAEIDEINILQASLLAMARAIAALSQLPDEVLIDGTHLPILNCPARTIVRGDSTVPAISAASILAKVTRDAEMLALDTAYPVYGFAQHKGYPTPAHIAALRQHGASPVHRRTFAPVRRCLVTTVK